MLSGGVVRSVNLGRARAIEIGGRGARSAIFKLPVQGPVRAAQNRLSGDEQVDVEHHGGPDKAVYAYALEDYRWWELALGRSLPAGLFGENLTTEGVDVCGAVIGERWAIGSCVLEVSEPRRPCSRLAARMQDEGFVKKFSEALRPGSYLRILEEGELAAGDRVRVLERPAHGLSIRDVYRIYTVDRHRAARLLSAPQLPGFWHEWAEERAARS